MWFHFQHPGYIVRYIHSRCMYTHVYMYILLHMKGKQTQFAVAVIPSHKLAHLYDMKFIDLYTYLVHVPDCQCSFVSFKNYIVVTIVDTKGMHGKEREEQCQL